MLNNYRGHFIAFLVALAYLAIGFVVLEDYGISYDEEVQRHNNGLANYNYFTGTDKEMLREGYEKYHGPAFELLLIGTQNVLNVNEIRSVYLLRHCISFLTFLISVITMYFLARKVFENGLWALFCTVMYCLSPRFFAEAFYNSKDIAFLAFFTCSLLTFYTFTSKQSYKWAVIHALVTGFMVDVRIIGIFVPIATIGYLIYQHILSSRKQKNWKSLLAPMAVYIVAQCVTIICFWPILWDNPWLHFQAAFSEMSKFFWQGDLRYFGNIIAQNQLPWHYLPMWMLITIPVPFLVLALIGVLILFKKLLSFNQNVYSKFMFDHLLLSFFVVPLVLIISIDSVVYDGWRHVYFLYAPMVLVSTRGAQQLVEKLKTIVDRKLLMPTLCFCGAILFLGPLISIIRYHPFQYVYFNQLSRMIFNPIHEKFEMDYWGLSYKQGLDYIIQLDSIGVVKLQAENAPGYDNRLMLSDADRSRLEYQDDFPDEGSFILKNDRAKMPQNASIPSLRMVKQINTPSGPVLSIYKVLSSDFELQTVREFFVDFENEGSATVQIDDSPNHVQRLDASSPYGIKVTYVVDSFMLSGFPAIRFESDIMSQTATPNLLSVVEITRNGSSIYWKKYWLGFAVYQPAKWETWRWSFSLKDVELEVGDVISTYTWTVDGAVCYQDDMQVEFVNCID